MIVVEADGLPRLARLHDFLAIETNLIVCPTVGLEARETNRMTSFLLLMKRL